MSILNSSVSKKISVKLSLNEINEIKLYIKGAVDGFCNINNGETFSVRRLFGGDNGNWNGTPLQAILIIMFLSVKITQRKSRLLMSVCYLSRCFPMMYIGNMS